MKLTEREKAYHDGYEQGRFDEYAERMGYDQAEKVKAKIDKQKNCPYCHGVENLLQSNDEIPIEGDIVYINDSGYLNLETDVIHAYRKINYCPMCGRPLNEEK